MGRARILLWLSVRLMEVKEEHGYPVLLIQDPSVTGGIRVKIGANPFLPKEGNYGRDALVAKVEALKSDIVDITVNESPWIAGDKSGVSYYLQDIKDAA
jgi:hypothetical protein